MKFTFCRLQQAPGRFSEHPSPAPQPAHKRTPWAGAVLWGVVTAVGLAACGGGDGPVVVAGADTLTINPGQTLSVLSNDSRNGEPVAAGRFGNVTFSLAPDALPDGVTVVDGNVSIAASAAPPGGFTFRYTICDTTFTANCATTSAQVVVPASAIVASDDTLTLAAGSTGDVLANDTLANAPATAATVTANATATLPPGVQLSAGGLLSVGTSVAAGSYSFAYQICAVAAPASCATASVSVTVPGSATLTGRAVNSATGSGIAGVTVSAGPLTTTTDAGGNFSLAGVPSSDRVTVLFMSADYAPTARVVSVSGTGSTDVQARLVRTSAAATLDIGTGGTVTLAGSTAQMAVLANSVQRADGSAPTGSIRVVLTPINPASDATVMPGDFTTVVSGSAVPIESFGALNVQLFDSAGAALNIQSGRLATLRIPLATRSASPPATVPMYYFDNATGRWVEEGSAALAGTGTARYYEGSVSRVGIWNVDKVYDVVRVSGCVTNAAGSRVAGVRINADGIDYSGTTGAFTDTGGNFVLPIRKNSLAAATGLSSGALTNTQSLGPYAQDTTLPNCLSQSQAGSGVTMKLTWGAAPSDLDSHLFAPNGSHIYFGGKGSLTAAPYASLDVDDVSSFGPEVMTLSRLMVGTYKYAVNNFSGQFTGRIGASGARVELNIPNRAVELFAPPATGETSSTDWWNLLEFDVTANCTITVRRVSALSTSPPTSSSITTPVYCVAP